MFADIHRRTHPSVWVPTDPTSIIYTLRQHLTEGAEFMESLKTCRVDTKSQDAESEWLVGGWWGVESGEWRVKGG